MMEVEQLRARVKRQWALRRINREDHDWLIGALDKIEAHIVSMEERGDEI